MFFFLITLLGTGGSLIPTYENWGTGGSPILTLWCFLTHLCITHRVPTSIINTRYIFHLMVCSQVLPYRNTLLLLIMCVDFGPLFSPKKKKNPFVKFVSVVTAGCEISPNIETLTSDTLEPGRRFFPRPPRAGRRSLNPFAIKTKNFPNKREILL
jgi:hypothetical protein